MTKSHCLLVSGDYDTQNTITLRKLSEIKGLSSKVRQENASQTWFRYRSSNLL
jgi:hypothetical protein